MFLKPRSPPPEATAGSVAGGSRPPATDAAATRLAARPARPARCLRPGAPPGAVRPAAPMTAPLGTRRQPPDRAAPGLSRRPLQGPEPLPGSPDVARCPVHRGRSSAGLGIDAEAETRIPRPPRRRRPASPAAGVAKAKDRPRPTAPKAAAKNAAANAAEPGMTAVADRIWAKVAIPRGQSLDPSKDNAAKKPRNKVRRSGLPTRPRPTPTASASAHRLDADRRAEGRRGRYSRGLAPRQRGGASGQAARPGQEGPGQAEGRRYQRRGGVPRQQGQGEDQRPGLSPRPHRSTPLPGPIRWAKVSTDDMITFGQVLWMDQEHDKVWAYGPGTVLQWTDRALMTDKTPEPQPAAEEACAHPPPCTMTARRAGPPSGPRSDVAAGRRPEAEDPRRRADRRQGPDHHHLDRADGVQRPDEGYHGPPRRPAPTSSASLTPR